MFSHLRKVLQNDDSGKHHKIWAKLYCLQIFFGGYAYGAALKQNQLLYVTLELKSLSTPGLRCVLQVKKINMMVKMIHNF